MREDTEGVSFFKKASSRTFYSMNVLGAVHIIPNGAADFCLVSRRVAHALQGMRERHRFLRGMIAWSGFSRALVPYRAVARAAGHSKYTLVNMIGMAVDAILSFSTVPIRLATRVGVFITGLGFAYLAWNLIRAFLTGQMAPGWASLIAVTMILGGSQLMFIGLIGQYLARVFEELKGRPMYILKQEPVAALKPFPISARARRSPCPVSLSASRRHTRPGQALVRRGSRRRRPRAGGSSLTPVARNTTIGSWRGGPTAHRVSRLPSERLRLLSGLASGHRPSTRGVSGASCRTLAGPYPDSRRGTGPRSSGGPDAPGACASPTSTRPCSRSRASAGKVIWTSYGTIARPDGDPGRHFGLDRVAEG